MTTLPPTASKAPVPTAGKAPMSAGKAPMGSKAPVAGGKAPLGGKAPALASKAAKKAAKASKLLAGGKGKEGGKGKGKGKERTGEKKAPVSQSVRAGLLFPVGRTHRLLKQYLLAGQRVGGTAAIYLAAAVEYVVSELLDSAALIAKDRMKVKRINARHILWAVRSDEELDALVHADIAGAGVVPHINPELLKRKKKRSSRRSRGMGLAM